MYMYKKIFFAQVCSSFCIQLYTYSHLHTSYVSPNLQYINISVKLAIISITLNSAELLYCSNVLPGFRLYWPTEAIRWSCGQSQTCRSIQLLDINELFRPELRFHSRNDWFGGFQDNGTPTVPYLHWAKTLFLTLSAFVHTGSHMIPFIYCFVALISNR